MTVRIRSATVADREVVQSVYETAFPAEERGAVTGVALALLDAPATTGAVSLVAELDGEVVGHVAFSPVSLPGDPSWRGYILAPLAVRADRQKAGIGSRLVETGLQHLTDLGADTVFVYGDPGYYGRFGFDAGHAADLVPPHALEYPFGWQAMPVGGVGSERRAGQIVCVDALRDPALW